MPNKRDGIVANDNVMQMAVLSALLDNGLMNKSIVVACSMGRDSLALLHVCQQLHCTQQICHLRAIHVHHHLQADADEWAESFVAFCQKHHISHQLLHVYPEHNEQDARQMRYDAIAQAMHDKEILFTAHHKADQCETVLMRLINGAGVLGLSAMKSLTWRQCRQQDDLDDGKKTGILLCRPLLMVDRQVIDDYIHHHQLAFVDDPSNHKDSMRAQLRQIMPMLSAINAGVMNNIIRTSQLADDLHQITTDIATQWMASIIVNDLDYYAVDITVLQKMGLPYVRLVLYHLFGRFAHDRHHYYHPNYEFIQQVVRLIMRPDGDHRTQIFWAGAGVMVHRYRQQLYVMDNDLYQSLMNGSPLSLHIDDAKVIGMIGRQDKVVYHKRTICGKKLYQNLGIAPIFRQWLYLCQYDGIYYLASLNMTWPLQDDADIRSVALPAFYLHKANQRK